MQERNIERQVTIGAYMMPYEADIVWSLLDAFEIEVFPADYYTIYIKWLYSNALCGFTKPMSSRAVKESECLRSGSGGRNGFSLF